MKKDPGNIDLNFEKETLKERNFKNDCLLFKCFKCGFHPSVITSVYIKGQPENSIHFMQNIKPGKIELIEDFGSFNLLDDGELVEENNCGKCGMSGQILLVPKDILKNMGIKINSDVVKDDKKINLLDRIKKRVDEAFQKNTKTKKKKKTYNI